MNKENSSEKIKLLLAIFILAFFTNCWYYSFKGTIPPHINSIAIPKFDNNTAEFNLSETVTEQVRVNFIRENILDVIDRDNATSILYGSITNIQDEPLVLFDRRAGLAGLGVAQSLAGSLAVLVGSFERDFENHIISYHLFTCRKSHFTKSSM